MLNDILCTAVIVYCHSKTQVMARFLYRAEDRNMTNGDFAWFTYWPQRNTPRTDRPWAVHVDPEDPSRDHRAYHVVKQVRAHYIRS